MLIWAHVTDMKGGRCGEWYATCSIVQPDGFCMTIRQIHTGSSWWRKEFDITDYLPRLPELNPIETSETLRFGPPTLMVASQSISGVLIMEGTSQDTMIVSWGAFPIVVRQAFKHLGTIQTTVSHLKFSFPWNNAAASCLTHYPIHIFTDFGMFIFPLRSDFFFF